MAKEAEAHATFVGPMRFDITSGSGHTVTLDVNEAGGGEDSGPSPMEVLLIALAGCTGMDVISILRKMRQDVTGYGVHVHGTRAEPHPQVFVEVTIEHVITGHQVDLAMAQRAVELSETKYCSVSNTINKTAKITAIVRVVEAEDPALQP